MEYLLLAVQALGLVGIIYIILSSRRRQPKSGQRLFVDTSVLIDGRIVAIAESGFIGQTLAIPRSVIGELQLLADGANGDKRSKARHGLDVIRELQAIEHVTVEIFADNPHSPEGVDRRLLKLTREYDGVLCTVDYNLNKVAQVEGIVVANVNELAKNLRMEHLPGTKLTLALTTKGNEASQAVGHLDDGTMVVVEQAKSKIGSVAEVEVIRSLQTDAGRMLFARLVSVSVSNAKPKRTFGRAIKTNDNKQSQPTKKSAAPAKRPSARKPATSRRKKPTNEDRLLSLVDKQPGN